MTKEKVLKIIDSVMNAYASEYRTEASAMAELLFDKYNNTKEQIDERISRY